MFVGPCRRGPTRDRVAVEVSSLAGAAFSVTRALSVSPLVVSWIPGGLPRLGRNHPRRSSLDAPASQLLLAQPVQHLLARSEKNFVVWARRGGRIKFHGCPPVALEISRS